MKFKPQIWHLLLFFWITIIIIRVELLIDLVVLWAKYFLLFISDFNIAMQLLDFNLIDSILSIKLFIIIPIILFLFRKKSLWLKASLNFSSLTLVMLLLAFIFAPIITDENPEFQKDLKMTKLLTPLSSVKILHLSKKENTPTSALEKFINYKHKIIKPSYNENIILVNNVEVKSDRIVYSQKNIQKEINFSDVQIKDGIPFVTNKIFILGTDEFGRDIFTRLIYGARISLLVGIGAVVVSLLIGLSFGFIAGFKGGFIDIIFSRLTDLFLAFPIIYFIVLILALFGNSLLAVIIVLGLSGWMGLFKIVKSEVLAEKNKDYIITAGMLGQTNRKILTKEILPVIFVPLVVNIVFQFSNVILAESALSYLGLGTGNSYPSWGAMIESGQRYIIKAWWMISFPGLILVATLLSANDFGRRLNKVINPGIRK
ncbi:MAG: ABC transporter permease [Bacteroidetes bacterium]|nr:ABC transporter permease [Bacteroidota bacterium]